MSSAVHGVALSDSPTSAHFEGQSIYELPPGADAESLAVRPGGSILLTGSGSPALREIDGIGGGSVRTTHTFPGVIGLNGIVEIAPDVFAVGAGNQTGLPDLAGAVGSWSLWTVDLNKQPVAVDKIADVPSAVLMDGLSSVAGSQVVLAADTQGGAIYRIDVNTGTVARALEDEALKGTNTSVEAGVAHLGVNGIQIVDQSVFFTNTAKQYLGRIPFNESSAQFAGPPSAVLQLGVQIDDLFVLDKDNFLVAANLEGIVLAQVAKTGTSSSSQLYVSYPYVTACTFGRAPGDLCTLYASYQGPNVSGLAKADLSGSSIKPGC